MTAVHNSKQCRAFAAKSIDLVINHDRTIDWVLNHHPDWLISPQTRHWFYETIRHYQTLAALVDPLLAKPLRKKDSAIYRLMLVGAYQLKIDSTPDHAAINETVAATKQLGGPWARGLVNAVLRQVTSHELKDDQTFGHPAWLVEAIAAAWPTQSRLILAANNTRAPMSLRVNCTVTDRDEYLERLIGLGIGAKVGPTTSSIVLDEPQPSATLPGWSEGAVAVQDLGAQFAAQLTLEDRAQPNKLLDACAAPGGKLAHLIEQCSAGSHNNNEAQQPAELVGIDISAERITQTQSVLDRLGHACALLVADATTLNWWDGIPFDHILVDAPCSGSGTIRRHPDIKLLLKETSVATLAELQLQILNNLWRTLSAGGTLLYCTCSILPDENDCVITNFINQPDNNASVCNIVLPTGQATQHGWQLLPTDPNTDGFYYARLKKPAS